MSRWAKPIIEPVVASEEAPPPLVEVDDTDYVDPPNRPGPRGVVRRTAVPGKGWKGVVDRSKINVSRGLRKYEITVDEALVAYPIPVSTRRAIVKFRARFRVNRAARTLVCHLNGRIDAGLTALLRQLSAVGVNQSLFIEAALIEKFEREGIAVPQHRLAGKEDDL